ncbi:4-hydroxy-tetrahydrodipicolinate reductase [Gammaproteobacteria bacterium]|nr:4-hydroxy-tetrahydrodipicolinate reductase [Gammaproteobacteria bacterium]|tara:strand:- start:935 stop:1594 length:660 start_codon:yes stop_codon:yes gene_type:complete
MIGILINGLSGKMGKNLLERSRLDSNIHLCKSIDEENLDIAIDFSIPESAIQLIESLKDKNIALIIGTTGFTEPQKILIKKASKNNKIMLAPNLSKGIAILKKSILDFLKSNTDELVCLIKETHHSKKLDCPSGTAIELERIIKISNTKNLISKIEILSERVGSISGIHEVIFLNKLENITFRHEALSRNIYSDGAIEAAYWLKDQKEGLYNFDDFLKS